MYYVIQIFSFLLLLNPINDKWNLVYFFMIFVIMDYHAIMLVIFSTIQI